MKNEELVNELIYEMEKKNWSVIESKLSDDFTFSGAVPSPISKKDWIKVHQGLQAGIPDLKFNLHDVKASGDKVKAKVKLSGTHNAELPVLLPGTKSIPKTGRKIELPEEEIELTFKGNKIQNFNVKPVPHGGVKGVLEQLGERVDL